MDYNSNNNITIADPELQIYEQLRKKWKRVRLESEKRDRESNGVRLGSERLE
jgi:hypothetical protein